MQLYDANPLAEPRPITKFEGDRSNIGGEIYASFQKAKQHAMGRLQRELACIQKEISELENTTADSCLLVDSPFD